MRNMQRAQRSSLSILLVGIHSSRNLAACSRVVLKLLLDLASTVHVSPASESTALVGFCIRRHPDSAPLGGAARGSAQRPNLVL